MSIAPSSNPRRYLAIWFPWLPSDRRLRERSGERDILPVVFADKIKGALVLSAVDPHAASLGLTPGMTLADARARVPDLHSETDRPDRDAALLLRVLKDFDRFTPMIADDPLHGLVLDITGCAHLFGDEADLLTAVRHRAARIGLQSRIAVAGTAQAARALCRFGQEGVYEPGDDRRAVLDLPVAALELNDKDELALRRAGLKRLSDLDQRARAPLAARFGMDFPTRLARLLGDEDRRITPHRPAPPIFADRIFFEPVSTPEDIERILADLLTEVMDQLHQAGCGGRAFRVGVYRLDGDIRRIAVRTGRPTRDIDAVMRLFRERFANLATPLDPGFGYDQIRLEVAGMDRLAAAQRGFQEDPAVEEDFARLVDRLTARLGPEAVLRFQAPASHMPERASRLVPAGAELDPLVFPDIDPDGPPLRPLQMFHPPQPVDALSEAPDGHPFRFRWRRLSHTVVLAEGPERIAGEWWRAPDQRTRDYYRIEDHDGRRFWLFRQGFYGEEPPPKWFIHGVAT